MEPRCQLLQTSSSSCNDPWDQQYLRSFSYLCISPSTKSSCHWALMAQAFQPRCQQVSSFYWRWAELRSKHHHDDDDQPSYDQTSRWSHSPLHRGQALLRLESVWCNLDSSIGTCALMQGYSRIGISALYSSQLLMNRVTIDGNLLLITTKTPKPLSHVSSSCLIWVYEALVYIYYE